MKLICTLIITSLLILSTTPALACSPTIERDLYETMLPEMIPCVAVTMEDSFSADVIKLAYTCAATDEAVVIRSGDEVMLTLDAQTVGEIEVSKEQDSTKYDGATRRWASRDIPLSWTQGASSGEVTLSYVRIFQPGSSAGCPEMDETCGAAPASRPASGAGLLMAALGLVVGWRRRR